ncbi:MAG: hypothetical protein PVS3B3_00710 [Ktedonobacteraceae bacterium]
MKTASRNQKGKKLAASESRKVTHSQPTSKQRYRVARAQRNPWFWAAIVLIPVMLIALVIVLIVRAQVSSTDPGTTGNISGVVTYSNLSRQHVSGTVNYPQVPPVGGNHNAVWQNCGIYTQPVANENAVHSMEHGAVWITYQPSLSTQDVNQLTRLASGHTYVLLSPYPNLPSPVVISAWGVQLKVTSASDPRLAQFLKYYEQGPQTQEQGAACSGGIGTPTGQ